MKKEREREMPCVSLNVSERARASGREGAKREREKERERLKIFPLKPLSSAKTPPDEKTAERKKGIPAAGADSTQTR